MDETTQETNLTEQHSPAAEQGLTLNAKDTKRLNALLDKIMSNAIRIEGMTKIQASELSGAEKHPEQQTLSYAVMEAANVIGLMADSAIGIVAYGDKENFEVRGDYFEWLAQ